MKISAEKIEKIQEQILAYLYTISPKSTFTSKISSEIARDEEFTKKLLLDLKRKSLVTQINKNAQGKPYLKRIRWRLGQKTYEHYKNRQ